MFSIIIPLYNKENTIINTINSVLNQSFESFELIIVNDGSIDKSGEFVKSIKDERIRIIEQPNEGVSSARNKGIDAAKHEYIAFLDGDDLWTLNHLEILACLISKFDNDSIGGYTTSFKKINSYDEIPKMTSSASKSKCQGHIVEDYFKEQSEPFELLSSSNFAIKKSKLYGERYDTKLRYGEDVEFWYRYFGRESCKLIATDRITAYYFVGAENRSTKNVIPLHQRFSDFNFQDKSLSEKKYLGKLVALTVIDYLFFKKPEIALKIFLKYIKQSSYIFRYFSLLIIKKLK